MRVNYTMVIFLAWISTMLLFTEYHKANFTLVEQAYAEQTLDSENVDASLKVSILDQVLDWIWSKHHQFQHSLTYELQKLRGRDSVGWSLVLISFLYGVLHAAGPGHGKVVLTTYLLTHRNQLRRGVAMGISAALLQGVTALLLVYGLVGLAGWLPKETESASMWATRLSFTLVAIVGLYLLLRASNVLFRTVHQMQYQSDPIHHDHTNHDNKEGCGCRHQPSVAEINSSSSKHAFAGVVLSIGLRPM
ncbi:MAG: hypothetical protein GKR95_17815 [Gammaproteobacteria bacterium]|nr:hypothetical protein [Gammaproteobacteria bacterium]